MYLSDTFIQGDFFKNNNLYNFNFNIGLSIFGLLM